MKGQVWEDEDFKVCKMDDYCSELSQGLEKKLQDENTRIFRAWRETWEMVSPGPSGNNYLQARMVKKYGGLKWLDPDSDYSPRTAHPNMMYFHKQHGRNAYHILACMDGYDFDKSPSDQVEKYDAWAMTDDLYAQIVDYYNNNTDDEMKVKCYTKDADCDSEEDE